MVVYCRERNEVDETESKKLELAEGDDSSSFAVSLHLDSGSR